MPSPVLSLFDVLAAEYESQGLQPAFPREDFARRRARYAESLAQELAPDSEELRQRLDELMVRDFYAWLHAEGARRSALCLSGGRIRIATFGLGIVQGLARHKMLGAFDFLSTVSGGGYLGSWLSAWIHRAKIDVVEEELRRRPDQPLSPEPEPGRHLRVYSRYMTPKAGLLSADTWTLVGIFLRNLLLNWLTLLPMMAAALMFPRLSTALILGVPPDAQEQVGRWVLGVAVVLGWLVISYIIANRPSLTDVDPPRSRFPSRFRSQGWFLIVCLLPLWILAVAVTAYWAWTSLLFSIFGYSIQPWFAFVLFGAVLCAGGFLMSRIWVHELGLVEGLMIIAAGSLGGLFCSFTASRLYPNLI